MVQTTLTTGVILLIISTGLFPANVQKRQSIYTGDDPHGLKVVGMPKARHKYPIIDLPSGTDIPAEYSTCGNGVYYLKEKVRGIDFTAVRVHFQAEGDIDLTGDPPDPSKPRFKAGFETYVPQGWVALTFTLLRDSFTIQEIRLIRAFPRRPIPGTSLEYGQSLLIRWWFELIEAGSAKTRT